MWFSYIFRLGGGMVEQRTKVKKRKHVLLQKIKYKGLTSWELLDSFGKPIIGYSLFMRHLIKSKDKYNTRRSYSLALAQFYDYLFEVASLYGGLTEELLDNACESYEVYMIKGSLAKDDGIAEEVASGLPSPLLKPKSYDVHHAVLQRFLRLSAKTTKHINQLNKAGFSVGSEQHSELPLFDTQSRELQSREKRQMVVNSVLASTMSGGAKTAIANVIERQYPSNSSNGNPIIFDEDAENRTFPWDRFQDLLDAAPNHRARTLWSLIAAIGCRFSEAIAILNSDIDITNRQVSLIAARERPDAYPYLNAEQLDLLAFKTRETRKTFMISWGAKFFEYLLAYRRSDEYRIAMKHDFLFQSQYKENYGEPQVFNSYTSMLNTLQSAIAKVLGKDGRSYGFHSLRHMYGFYLMNYAPRADGDYGLDLAAVQGYMGHAHPASTRRYALEVKEKLELQLIYANEASSGREGPRLLADLKMERNRKEYEQLLAMAKERQLLVDKRFVGVSRDD
jgi:integrase